MINQYTHEKVLQLERELMERHALNTVSTVRKPVLGLLISRTGRALQRIGDGLESWGNPEQVSVGR